MAGAFDVLVAQCVGFGGAGVEFGLHGQGDLERVRGEGLEPALDFPDMNFVVHHLAFPFEDLAIDLASRLPNVYLAMSTWINMIQIAPVETAMRFGKMLSWCSPEKVIWGSETPLWPSAQHLLDLSYDFQIPEDLRAGWNFPEITDEDRRLMFGGNIIRLLGLPESSSAIEHELSARMAGRP